VLDDDGSARRGVLTDAVVFDKKTKRGAEIRHRMQAADVNGAH
jgi:hypothetical protein